MFCLLLTRPQPSTFSVSSRKDLERERKNGVLSRFLVFLLATAIHEQNLDDVFNSLKQWCINVLQQVFMEHLLWDLLLHGQPCLEGGEAVLAPMKQLENYVRLYNQNRIHTARGQHVWWWFFRLWERTHYWVMIPIQWKCIALCSKDNFCFIKSVQLCVSGYWIIIENISCCGL